MKIHLNMLLTLILGLSLCACGSSEQKEDPASETQKPAETQSETQEKTPEPAVQPVRDASYTDPSAFAGFASYTINYRGQAANDFVSGEVIFGETLLKDHYKGRINETELLDDLTHEDIADVEMIEPGKTAKAETSYLSMFAKDVAFYVYNHTDAPARPEDCVIIGIENEAARAFAFSGGITIIETEQPQNEDPVDSLTKVLGEPYEMDADDDTPEYTWRDQNGDHILELEIWTSGGLYQTIDFKYVDYTAGK